MMNYCLLVAASSFAVVCLLLLPSHHYCYASVSSAKDIEIDPSSGEQRQQEQVEEKPFKKSGTSSLFTDIFSGNGSGGGGAAWGSWGEKLSISSTIKDVITSISSSTSSKEGSTTGIDEILSAAREIASKTTPTKYSIPQLIEQFKLHFETSKFMLRDSFAHIDFKQLTLASLWYYIEYTESVKTPSWKRRLHRYDKRLDSVSTMMELHDALYLMQIAYLPTYERVEEEISKFQNGSYELLAAVTKTIVAANEPAHFIILPKVRRQSTSVIEIVIAVRGSGEINDFITDSMMNATKYRSGKAHDGIVKSGRYLANTYISKIQELKDTIGVDTVKVTLVGYSLGAGIASIAAIELNDYSFIDAQAIAFGCPALLDKEQAMETKDYITTIISDADITTRMSGASIGNMLLDIMSHDWTKIAMVDVEFFVDHVAKSIPGVDKEKVMAWVNDTLTTKYKPTFSAIPIERMEQELYLPGTCIHLWRNGGTNGWDATYTDCTNEVFGEVEFVRNLIDDHRLDSGYHSALVGLARKHTKDLNFDFEHDLMALSLSTK